ncbi:MAG: Methyl-accepting chemotaxis protein PctB [Candidatus Celerinatantimonas neptuna]|nr:MAG: Methyl-accepting chemotaxis protein PctB [Candidatus Celerinatantimonas neptuna]
MKIRTKLTIVFSLAAIIPVAILAFFSIDKVTQVQIEQFQKATSQEIVQIDNGFNIFFNGMKKNVNYLATLPHMQDTIADPPKFVTPNDMKRFKGWGALSGTSKTLFDQFALFGRANKDVFAVYTGRADGGMIEWPGADYKKPYDPRVRPWYKLAMQNPGQTVMTNAYYWDEADSTLIAVAKAVTNAQNQVVGVVSLDVSIQRLMKIVERMTVGEAGVVVLLEDSKTILVDPIDPQNNFKHISDVNTPFFRILHNNPTGIFEVERNGVTYLGKSITSKYLGWHFVALVPKAEVYQHATEQTMITFAIVIPLVIIFIVLAFYVSRAITSNINHVTGILKEISQGHGDLTVKLNVDSKDEIGELAYSFNLFVDKLSHLISEVISLSTQLKQMADDAYAKADMWKSGTHQQLEKVTLVAEAITEMSKATTEIASNSEQAASVAEQGADSCESGKEVVQHTQQSIQNLANEVQTTNSIIGELNENTQQITTIISTIQGIAEQTNLLALNAAIEAARAGEHGRGFAVVADEVRSLSQKTTSSTEEIQRMINELQQTTQRATSVMENSRSMTSDAVEQANVASEALVGLATSIGEIKGTSIQIATATEEQSCVCDDITGHTKQINDIAEQLTDEAQGQLESAEEFRGLSKKLFDLVGKFKVKKIS